MLKHQVKTLTKATPQPRRRSILDDDCSNYGVSTSSLSIRGDKSPSSSSASGCGREAVSGGRRRRGRSCSVSSLSSADSSTFDFSTAVGSYTTNGEETGCLKIYTDSIRPETDYKTVFATTSTTTGKVIEKIMSKFRIGYKDPKLFYLTMELYTRREGTDVETTLVLDSSSRPLELQSCHPQGKSRFRLKMTPGVPVRIYDYCVSPQSNYKSVLVSRISTCDDAIGLMLMSSRLDEPIDNFILVTVDTKTGYDYILPGNTQLLAVHDSDNPYSQLHLRYARSRYLLTSPFTERRQSSTVVIVDSETTAPPLPSMSFRHKFRLLDTPETDRQSS